MLEKKYFLGEEVGTYGVKNNRVDYYTLSKTFDHVLCNCIPLLFFNTINGEVAEPEVINGCDYNEDTEEYTEIYQYYIISSNGADILQEYTDEIVYYIESLDLYIWGVTHWGTSWDYVLTEIEL